MATEKERDRLTIVEQQLKSLSEKVDCNNDISNKGIIRLEEAIKSIDKKLDRVITEKADKEDFIFWRNLLVSGIICSILLMLISIMFK
jgi:hypothetical protein